jgi:hypothetical protein
MGHSATTCVMRAAVCAGKHAMGVTVSTIAHISTHRTNAALLRAKHFPVVTQEATHRGAVLALNINGEWCDPTIASIHGAPRVALEELCTSDILEAVIKRNNWQWASVKAEKAEMDGVLVNVKQAVLKLKKMGPLPLSSFPSMSDTRLLGLLDLGDNVLYPVLNTSVASGRRVMRALFGVLHGDVVDCIQTRHGEAIEIGVVMSTLATHCLLTKVDVEDEVAMKVEKELEQKHWEAERQVLTHAATTAKHKLDCMMGLRPPTTVTAQA